MRSIFTTYGPYSLSLIICLVIHVHTILQVYLGRYRSASRDIEVVQLYCRACQIIRSAGRRSTPGIFYPGVWCVLFYHADGSHISVTLNGSPPVPNLGTQIKPEDSSLQTRSGPRDVLLHNVELTGHYGSGMAHRT